MTNTGTLGGMWRCTSAHVFAVVRRALAGCFPRCAPIGSRGLLDIMGREES
jgi:hypothetical protein